MKIEKDRCDYPAPENIGELLAGTVSSGDPQTMEGSWYLLAPARWEFLEELYERENIAERRGRPTQMAISPDKKTIRIFPKPGKDYEASIKYATFHAL